MTGPEHYEKAERLIEVAQVEHDRDLRISLHSRAQVHATLALAAATALAYGDPPTPDWNAWCKVASEAAKVAAS